MAVKQVIVMRKDLNMRKGKIAAQAAHASMKVFFDLMVDMSDYRYLSGIRMKNARLIPTMTDEMVSWVDGQFTKICVSVNSESEIDALYLKAQELGIPCSLIVDSGLTEFNGVHTKTCIAIGPDLSEKIDSITGGLPLL